MDSESNSQQKSECHSGRTFGSTGAPGGRGMQGTAGSRTDTVDVCCQLLFLHVNL